MVGTDLVKVFSGDCRRIAFWQGGKTAACLSAAVKCAITQTGRGAGHRPIPA